MSNLHKHTSQRTASQPEPEEADLALLSRTRYSVRKLRPAIKVIQSESAGTKRTGGPEAARPLAYGRRTYERTGRRQNAKQRREMATRTNRAVRELGRFQDHAGELRSRAENVIERVKRLV